MAWLICKAIHNVENSLKKSHFQTKNILSEPRCLTRIVSVKMSHLKRRIQNDIQNVTFEMSHFPSELEMSHFKCLIQNVSPELLDSKCLIHNFSLKMSHLNCLTQNVSFKMYHSKYLTKNVSFKMS